MIAFFFPVILGALIGFTFDDGNIDKSDFTNIKKELLNPMSDSISAGKDSVIKAFKNVDAPAVVINR